MMPWRIICFLLVGFKKYFLCFNNCTLALCRPKYIQVVLSFINWKKPRGCHLSRDDPVLVVRACRLSCYNSRTRTSVSNKTQKPPGPEVWKLLPRQFWLKDQDRFGKSSKRERVRPSGRQVPPVCPSSAVSLWLDTVPNCLSSRSRLRPI